MVLPFEGYRRPGAGLGCAWEIAVVIGGLVGCDDAMVIVA